MAYTWPSNIDVDWGGSLGAAPAQPDKAEAIAAMTAAKAELDQVKPDEIDVTGTRTVAATDIGKILHYTGGGHQWTLNTITGTGEIAVENAGGGAITFTGTATRSGATSIGIGKSATLRFFNGGANVKILVES